MVSVAFCLGSVAADFILPRDSRRRLDFVVISVSLGVILLAVVTLLMGLCGLLYPTAAWVAFCVLAVLSLIRLAAMWSRGILPTAGNSPGGGVSILSVCFGGVFAAFIAFNCVSALVPTIHHDTLTQYLVYPKIWLIENGFTEIPFHFTDNMVFWVQALHAFCMLLRDDTLARLFSVFGLGVLSAAVVYMLARKYCRREIALLAAAIYYCSQDIVLLGTSGRVNLALASYEVLAIYCFFTWMDSRPAEGARWAALCGLFAGFAAGIHMAGLKTVVILLFLLGAVSVFRARGLSAGAARTVAVFLAVAAIAASPLYVKNFIQCGNPMYPFMRGVFGGDTYTGIFSGNVLSRGQEAPTLRDYLCVLWDITVKPWHETRSQTICPLIVVFLPLIVLIRVADRRIWRFLCVAALFYTAWFFSQRFSRYAFNYLSLLSIVAAYVACALIGSRKRVVAAVTVVAVLSVFGLEMERNFRWLHRDLSGLRCAFGLMPRDAFIYKFSVGDPFHPNYKICQYINTKTAEAAVVFGTSEEERYWLERTYIPVRDPLGVEMYYQESPEELLRLFRENGVTHVLFSERYIERINWHMRRVGVTEEDFFPRNSLFTDDDFRRKCLKKIFEDSGDLLFEVQYPDRGDA